MSIPEQTLVEQCKNGDYKAFEGLVSLYEKRVYNLAFRLTGSREDAEDMAQEGFLKVFTSLKHFRGDSSFSTWLYRVVTNTCLDQLRKRSRQRTVSLDTPFPNEDAPLRQFASDDPLPADVIERRELQAAVQQGITLLSPDHRAILVLRDIQGLSYDEIAGTLGIELGTVKSRLNRARLSLRRHLLAKELLPHHDVNMGGRRKKA